MSVEDLDVPFCCAILLRRVRKRSNEKLERGGDGEDLILKGSKVLAPHT